MDESQSGKISKKEYQEYLRSLMQEVIPEGQKGATEVVLKAIHYLAENYSNLDKDMQEFTDKLMDETLKHADTILKETPDTPETLLYKRMLRALKKNLPSANGLIRALESPCEIKDPLIIETRRLFEKYFQAWLETLFDVVDESHSGKTSFAKLQMLFLCMDELTCSFHSAQRGYVNQAYAHLRTILESLNRLELFIKDESYADLWCSGNEKGIREKLKPSKVREKLGVKKDPFYSFLCAFGTHPSFEYVKIKSYKSLSEKGDPEINFCLGGTKSRIHIFHSNLGCILALMQLLLLTGKAFDERVHSKDFKLIIDGFITEFKEYINNFSKQLKAMGVDTTDLDLYLNDAENWKIDKGGDYKRSF